MSWKILAAVTLTFIWASLEARAQSLAAQKLNREINFNLSQVRVLEKSNPAKARELLRDCKRLLEDDVELPERQRQELLEQVTARLRQITVRISEQKKADELAAQQAADKVFSDPRFAPPKNPGNGPNDLAKSRILTARDQQAAAEKLKAMREKGFRGIFDSLDYSATPIAGEIEYPRYWKTLTEMRAPKLHPKEVALLKALNSTLSVDFNNDRFRDVLNYLQEKTGQPIIIDEASLKEAMVEYDDPVTFNVKKVTFRTILRKILADRGLSYVIREGTLQVVTTQKAREMVVVRAYPVSDLVGANPMFYGPFTPFAVAQNVQALIFNIQSSIEPTYWNVNGGPGVITFNPATMSLIVRASSEIQYMFGSATLMGR